MIRNDWIGCPGSPHINDLNFRVIIRIESKVVISNAYIRSKFIDPVIDLASIFVVDRDL